jgi:hypothetical protein
VTRPTRSRQIEEVKTEFDQGKKKIEEMLSQANIKLDEGEGEKPANEREAPKSLEGPSSSPCVS